MLTLRGPGQPCAWLGSKWGDGSIILIRNLWKVKPKILRLDFLPCLPLAVTQAFHLGACEAHLRSQLHPPSCAYANLSHDHDSQNYLASHMAMSFFGTTSQIVGGHESPPKRRPPKKAPYTLTISGPCGASTWMDARSNTLHIPFALTKAPGAYQQETHKVGKETLSPVGWMA